MDLLNYIEYHYVDETPDWVKNVMGLQPKSMNDIIYDLFIKFIMMLLIISIFYWGIRILYHFWTSYNQKMREANENNRVSSQNNTETGHQLNDNTEDAKEMPVKINPIDLQEIGQQLKDVTEGAKEMPAVETNQPDLQDFGQQFQDNTDLTEQISLIPKKQIDLKELSCNEYHIEENTDGTEKMPLVKINQITLPELPCNKYQIKENTDGAKKMSLGKINQIALPELLCNEHQIEEDKVNAMLVPVNQIALPELPSNELPVNEDQIEEDTDETEVPEDEEFFTTRRISKFVFMEQETIWCHRRHK